MTCHHRTPEGHAAFDDGRSCRYCGESALMVLDAWGRELQAVRALVWERMTATVPACMKTMGDADSRTLRKVEALLFPFPVSPPANPEG